MTSGLGAAILAAVGLNLHPNRYESWIPQLTAWFHQQYFMVIDFFGFETVHLLGESATHPIEPLATRPGSLLRLAGSSLLRCRAYPDTPPAAHSDASN